MHHGFLSGSQEVFQKVTLGNANHRRPQGITSNWFRRLANGRTKASSPPIPVDEIPWDHVP